MIEAGRPAPLGATFDGEGVNFAIFSDSAEAVALCLFDTDGKETARLPLGHRTDGIWHGYLPGCRPGQHYGYRMHGPYRPEDGKRFNSNKLLIDPYARALSGEFRWSPAVFDFEVVEGAMHISKADSAAFVPKCVVAGELARPHSGASHIPWAETIIYEVNVRGYTMRHPGVSGTERGKFTGMTNVEVLSYMKSLGITSVELMPVQEFIDEEFLNRMGLRNFWGYNTINFFVPARRYARACAREDFRDMVNAIHDAGMEILLDVVYNHTGEADSLGPTISFRGIDNLCYYRTAADDPGTYVNDTGCGNTINVDHPRVRALIIDSLRYWAAQMGVDGFRFDLATVLARTAQGFTARHALLQAIDEDKLLKNMKFIAEPWDTGNGGYQLGGFPAPWAEWNDKYRDSVRRFWRGDRAESAELAKRLLGSSDVFADSGRRPWASINLITAHDGFTLADVVSYETRHNEANGEHNLDGHAHNFSSNYGIEGESNAEAINAVRRKQRLNMLATLFSSQGTPMLLAGDEFGNSQHGNNNAYAQDNETGWIDWSRLDADRQFQGAVRTIILMRKQISLLRQQNFLHGRPATQAGRFDIEWLRPDGLPLQAEDWPGGGAIGLFLASTHDVSNNSVHAAAIILNPSDDAISFVLPKYDDHLRWRVEFISASGPQPPVFESHLHLAEKSFACLTYAS